MRQVIIKMKGGKGIKVIMGKGNAIIIPPSTKKVGKIMIEMLRLHNYLKITDIYNPGKRSLTFQEETLRAKVDELKHLISNKDRRRDKVHEALNYLAFADRTVGCMNEPSKRSKESHWSQILYLRRGGA